MSHFTVYAFTEDCPNECCCVYDLMQPYDENLRQYRELTFQEVENKYLEQTGRLAKAQAGDPPGMEEYREVYANNLARYNNLETMEEKMEFLSGWFGYDIADGFFVDYGNPNAKWDYWITDGSCQVCDLPEDLGLPYAFVSDDGIWHAPGDVGWFGTSTDTEESRIKYEEEFWKYLHSLPEDMWVSFLDCHI